MVCLQVKCFAGQVALSTDVLMLKHLLANFAHDKERTIAHNSEWIGNCLTSEFDPLLTFKDYGYWEKKGSSECCLKHTGNQSSGA